MGCFPVDFQEVKRPLRTKSVKRPIKVGKRPINEGKRPIKAKVLVGVSVGCLMGCFRAPPPWRKTAPLKRPIKRSMKLLRWGFLRWKSREKSTNRKCQSVILSERLVLEHVCKYPEGPKTEKSQSRLKCSVLLEIFNLDLQNSPPKIGVWWVARLKCSISLENFKIFQNLDFFQSLGL